MSKSKNTSKNTFKNELEPEKKVSKKKSSLFKDTNLFVKNDKTHKVLGVFLILFSLYLTFSFISFFFTWWMDYDKIADASLRTILFDRTLEIHNWTGRMGAALANLMIRDWFGIASFTFVFLSLNFGLRLFKIVLVPISLSLRYSIFILLFVSISLGFIIKGEKLSILDGVFGYESSQFLEGLLGRVGAGILLLFGLVSFVVVAFNFTLNFYKKREKKVKEEADDFEDEISIRNVFTENNKANAVLEEEEELEEGALDFELIVKEPINEHSKPINKPIVEDVPFTVEVPVIIEDDIIDPAEDDFNSTVVMEHKTIDTDFDPRLDLGSYQFPSLDLLYDYNESPSTVQNEELIANKNKIIETLRNYSIEIIQIKATIGPTVTLYEIVPAPGVRISKIKNLEDDIALSLAALGIRIIAPIPGKGTIGIEVPNQNPQIVAMKTMLSSDKFQNSKFELPIAIGKTIANEPFIADLAKMPHLLMAGATGQGKSVGLNAIIASLLYKKHPAELKFVMVDPKKVELTLFNKIERHFLAKLPDSEDAIITDTRKVVRTLNSLTIEMDQRYDLLKDAQVKNIKEYNTKFISRKLNPNDGHRYMPYIVLVVDEFADLIMTAGKEVETPIARLAQLARAIGIHLIIATQRPSVNIITGTIKANFPARVAFRVISKIDSRTILDTGGADQLIGRGDMLLSTGSDLIRLQCAFIDTPEIDKVAEFIGSQRGYASAFNLPEYLDEDSEPNKDFDPSQKDDLFEDAARIIVVHQHGSTSLLQRKLKLGYNRAGRIIDQLEAAGIVGPFEGSKAREVKYKDEIALEQYLRDYNQNH